jgi:hypothetical protein
MNLKKSTSAPADDAASVEGGSSTNKLLLVGAGVVGLAAAGALAFVLLSGGGEPVDQPVALPRPAASAAPAATETASPSTSASIPTYAAKNARDPFKALVSDSTGGGAASGSGSSSTAPTTAPSGPSTSPSSWTPPATTVTVTSKPSTSTTTRTSSPSSSPTTSEPTVPYNVNVVVLDKIVDATTVQMYAGDTPLVLHVGDAPVGPFALKSVDTVNQTATVQYGEVTVTLQLHQVVFLQQS